MRKLMIAASLFALTACGSGSQTDVPVEGFNRDYRVKPEGAVRVATFNVSFYRDGEGEMIEAIESGTDPQVQAVADIIKRVDPDVLLLNEIDWDNFDRAVVTFRDNYLDEQVSEGFRKASYPYIFVPKTNTGEPSGVDLDNDGAVVTEPGSRDYGNDAFGYGAYPGQYGMAILSKFNIFTPGTRTFQTFKWRDMPDNLMPTDFYSDEAQEVFRLSSKNHVDASIAIGEYKELRLLVSHPTPPGFDGEEDRNGRRNHDEIRFWADYISPARSDYIYDDKGQTGGIKPGVPFVIAGDLNADPNDGDSRDSAIQQLLDHPRVDAQIIPASGGGTGASSAQGGVNLDHRGNPQHDTADFRDEGQYAAGNLRVDYVLPSADGLKVVGAGVFWPGSTEEGYDLVGSGNPVVSSDHRLVWIDIVVDAQKPE